MAVVLLIDDLGVRRLLEQTLTLAGHTAVAAINGKQGVELCSTCAPELVITDLLMPEKEGLETIQEIRSQLPTVPILAISGAPQEWKVLKIAERLGADEVIAKPFAVAEILASVHRLTTVASE